MSVARTRSLDRPFVEFDGNPVLRSDEFARAPGHNAVVVGPYGGLFARYHAYVDGLTQRSLMLDRLEVLDGWSRPTSDTATRSWLAGPSPRPRR